MGLAFSSANLLASGAKDAKVKIWNPDTGGLLKTLLHSHAVYSVAFSTTNSSILAAGSYTIRLFDVDTGNLLFILDPLEVSMMTYSCAFSSRNILATASDFSAKLWNPGTGTLIQTLVGHTSNCFGVAFNPSGLLATSSYDLTIKLWNPETGVCLNTITGHSSNINGLAFSSSGLLASASFDQTCRQWSLVAG